LILGVVVAILATAASACDKSKPKPAENEKSEGAAVPSGSASPASADATGSGVRDGGLGGAAAGGDKPVVPNDEPSVKVVDPGAERRVARKYAFVVNKVDERVLSVSMSTAESTDGQPAHDTMRPMETTYHLELTPKQVKPTGATIEIKATKVEAPTCARANRVDARWCERPYGDGRDLGAWRGGPVDGRAFVPRRIEGHGSTGPTKGSAKRSTDTRERAARPSAARRAAPHGADWRGREVGDPDEERRVERVSRFVLKEVTAEGGAVEAATQLKIARHPAPAPDGGGTAFVELTGGGRRTQDLRFNQLSRKAESEIASSEKVEIPDPNGKMQTVVQVSVMKQTLVTQAE
jgi:hypothetical protein